MYLSEDIKRALMAVAAAYAKQAQDAVRNKPILRKTPRMGVFKAPAYTSGRLANSIEYNLKEDGVMVTALGYIHYIIYGRQPGKFAPADKIEEWCKIKGINAPYAVNRALAINGSSIWQYHQGKDSGLLADIDIDKEMRELTEVVQNQVNINIWQ